MNILISTIQAKVAVTIFHIQGSLDGSNYKELIAKAQEAYQGGARNFLLDLSEVTFISSAGIVALHTVSKMVKGQKLPDTEQGWETFRSIDRDRDQGLQSHVKLLKPQPPVERVLDTVGFTQFFEIYWDMGLAIASFKP
jgi:anti-anti-sigma factor